MARARGWAGTLAQAGTAGAQLHLPISSGRVDWGPCLAVRSGQDQTLAPALSWVWVLRTPDLLPCPWRSPAASLGCLEPAPPLPCTPAMQPALPPTLAWRGSAASDAPPWLPAAQDGLCRCFLVLPASHALRLTPGLLGGVPITTAAASSGWFAPGQPAAEVKVEFCHVLEEPCGGSKVVRLPGLAAWTPCSPQPCWTCSLSPASCKQPGAVAKLGPLLLSGQSLVGPRGAVEVSLSHPLAPC